jgi:hypothetical protein
MAKTVSGMVDKNGDPAEGTKFYSSVQSQNPWIVVVTYKEPFDRVPVAFASVSDSKAGVNCTVQSSNTSLAIFTDSATPVALFFSATTVGLG